MKLQHSFAIAFFLIAVVLSIVINLASLANLERTLIKETSDILVADAESKADALEGYLSGLEEEAELLKNSGEVIRLLKEEVIFDEAVMKRNIGEKTRIASKEIENYIKAHPKMTLKDLQESEEFKKLAVQPIGNDGYTALFDSDTLITGFHKEERRIGYDSHDFALTFPELLNLFEENSRKGSSEGFYRIDEENGSVAYKYGSFAKIPVRTADGLSLSVAITAYNKEYNVIKAKSDHLNNLVKEKGYSSLLLIKREGDVVYAEGEPAILGTNLNWEENRESGFSRNYFKTLETGGLSFYGPFIEGYGELYPKISVIVPVRDSGDLLGYACMVKEMDELFEIVKDVKGLKETGESYLINKDLILISPLRDGKFDIMVQSIDNENSKNCFEEKSPESSHAVEKATLYLDYTGGEDIGTYVEIPRIGWCLLAEMDKSEAVDVPVEDMTDKHIYFSIVAILILTIIGFFLGKHIDNKCAGKGIRGYLAGEGQKGTIFSNLKLSDSAGIALAFLIAYFFLVTLFFQGWMKPAVYDEISDLSTTFVLILLFFYGFKLKSLSARLFIILGSSLAILDKLVQVVLEEYINTFGYISAFYWVPGAVIGFAGLILIFLGSKEELK
ncbi:hypothetical protein JXB11_02775 [Candidatus Woesearchaeota archaeon]|nr:hypothetical protein [Candidatus Woesearchaeota archaeon]